MTRRRGVDADSRCTTRISRYQSPGYPLIDPEKSTASREECGMATIEELMRANLLEVFNERDGDRRRAAIDRTYAA